MEKDKYHSSKELLARARKVTPVAAQTYSKSYRYYSGNQSPYFVERGEKGHVWDVDGNEFVDFVLSLGAVSVGYNHPRFNEALEAQIKKGISFSQPTALEAELAEKLIDIIPCAQMVRFLKNGSDATSVCVRLARAFTGREIIAVCGYHGMDDWFIGSTENNRGVPQGVRKLIRRFSYNDINSLEKVFAEGEEIAAVIMEPVQGNGPQDDFLTKVRQATQEHGALLIFDEVVSGFRIALGGAQFLYSVTPDLASFGKGMANGLPLSAAVGRQDIMRQIEQDVFVSTTFGGEALSLAGALKTIEILSQDDALPGIWKKAERFQGVLKKAIDEKGLGHVAQVNGLPPHSGVIFKQVGSLAPLALLSVYQQSLLGQGILSLGINNFCLDHTDADIDRHIRASEQALDVIKECVEKDSVDGILQEPVIDPIFKRN